jgi:hypothetical protein
MLTNDSTTIYFLEDGETVSDTDAIYVSKINDDIFYSYDDLNRNTYFTAKHVVTKKVDITADHSGYIDLVGIEDHTFIDYIELWCDGVKYTWFTAGWDAAKYDRDVFDNTTTKYDDSDIFVELVNCKTARIKDVSLFAGKTVEIRGFAQSYDTIGPFEIVDYKNNVTVANNMILWNPAAGIYDPVAMKNISAVSDVDPASYNMSPATAGRLNYFKFKPWGENEVGRVWFNTANLDYLPYYDRFLTPDLAKRVSLWGTPAEYSTYNVYRWIESDMTPADHLKKNIAGEIDTAPAMKTLYTTERVWSYTPIAWKYSKNPKAKSRAFFDTVDNIQFKNPSSPDGTLVAIDKHTFEYNDIDDNNTTLIVYGDTIEDIVGEYRITDFEKYYVVGTDEDFFNVNVESSEYFSNITIEVNDADTSTIRNNLGKFRFAIETSSDVTYVKIQNTLTGDLQKIVISDTENLIGARETYYFDRFGVKVKFVCVYDHSSTMFGTTETRIAQIAALFESLSFSVREAMWAETFVPVSSSAIIGTAYSTKYVAFYTPTPEDLESDGLSPSNKFEPVYGSEIELGANIIDLHTDTITKQIKSPLIWQGGEIKQYTYDLNDWVACEQRIVKFKYVSAEDFDQKTIITAAEAEATVRIYVNGAKTTSFVYDAQSDGVHIVPSIKINVGDIVVLMVLVKDVLKDALSVIDKIGTKDDDATNNTLYKYDCDYSTKRYFDSASNSYVVKYYYWAVGDTLASKDGMTLSEIKNRLRKYNSPFAILNDVTGASGNLPVRYKSVVLNDLKFAVDRVDSYKVKFNIHHYLRKFETDLSRKNIHTEWKLIKRTMIDKIPEKLWTKFVDSIVGETEEGISIPVQSRVRYDKKHGTTIQYGFGDDQTLFDSSDAKEALVYYVEELDKYIEGGIVVDGFDLDDFVSNINDASITRKYLTVLRNKMKTEYVNSLFFDIIELGLAYNYVFTDLIKSSYISIVSSKELKVFE